MKLALFSLMAAALCLHMGHALKCYTCLPQPNNHECLHETLCPSNATHCVTVIVPPPMSNNGSGHNQFPMIAKTCNVTCLSGEQEYNGVKYSASCCQSDLCNNGGAINETTTRGTSGTTSGQTTASGQTSGTSGQTNGATNVISMGLISVGLISLLLQLASKM
uniref:Secreted Ly-6/uPAR-related protein 1-like n=1 Tax=Geotrypetes seraphini TaxID=260995 RepID=A0A6P8QQ71_GEOSA|nr:secreted Ly-6/uPAR-related protein 1-like [Geotrypetes seraphini]